MVNKAKIDEWMTTATEALNEQEWFQQLRGKWDELDPQSKTYLRFALVGIAVFTVALTVLVSIWNVHVLKSDLNDKMTLLNTIQSSTDEIRRLKDSIPAAARHADKDESGGGAVAWTPYFEGLAATAGIDKTLISVQGEKPGQSSDYSKESLFDIGVKHVNIKQLTKFTLSLETGQKPVKLRNLSIDTQEDLSGYIDATLAVSAFTPVATQ